MTTTTLTHMAEALRAADVREARTPYGTVIEEGGSLRIRGTREQVRTWATMHAADDPHAPLAASLSPDGRLVDAEPAGAETLRWAHDVMVDAVTHEGGGSDWLIGYVAARAREAAGGNGTAPERPTVREDVTRILAADGGWMTARQVREAGPGLVGRELNDGSVYEALQGACEDREARRRKRDGQVTYRLAR